jgi:hypothetical protein
MRDRPTADKANPDHHLWDNNGTWWMHYTLYPTPMTKERVRRSLKTKSVVEARARRDEILQQLAVSDDSGDNSNRFVALKEAA